MNTVFKEQFKLIGISLPYKTYNADGKSMADCGSLWQKFEEGGYYNLINDKTEEAVYAVYHNYDGDHNQPYSFFIGCKVALETEIDGFTSLIIPENSYKEIIAAGEIPKCIANSWKEIWKDEFERAYKFDFEIYDNRSSDWKNAEVPIYISIP